MMLPTQSKLTGYTSCIKIGGVPILPPLVTEERRKELNDDKQKAIDFEKRLKVKRNSIDSGVMTGSYIDNLKNNESHQTDDISLQLLYNHGIPSKENLHKGISSVSPDGVSDSFLKTALEDPEFREYFSNTAEKIFKGNGCMENLNVGGDFVFEKVKYMSSERNDEIYLPDIPSESSSLTKPSELLDLGLHDDPLLVSSSFESFVTSKGSETVINTKEKESDKQHLSPTTISRVRRNSYTLESPSPVLLEHMAKEIANSKKEAEKWHSLSDKKEKAKGPGFKTLSGRKTWNKKISNPASILKVENPRNKHTLRRSNTFIKSNSKTIESNYSLPSSSRTSPFQCYPFTRSVDCIKSFVSKPPEKEENEAFNFNSQYIKVKNVSPNDAVSDNETVVVGNSDEPESAGLEISPTSLVNNPSSSIHSNCSTDASSSPKFDYSDTASQISVNTQTKYIQQNLMSPRNPENENIPGKLDRSEDFDDLASLCSSMSISRFLPSTHSWPSTAEDLSETGIRQLKMKHEKELRELLEKQQKEEEVYSQLLSNSGSVSSRTTLSISDLFDINSEILNEDKSRNSCNRELFPTQKRSPDTKPHKQDHYSEKEKKAASLLTACAKGYLTRRLLKTEKVQQLIELIKESLNCAFSLQLEPQLKRNDLDLHERLAHQLTAALYELQTIIAAPVASRMAIIAADREKLKKPHSRPSSAISAATRKSILRRQQSLNSGDKVTSEARIRTKSFSISGNGGSVTSGSHPKSDSSSSTFSMSSNRKPWR